MTDSFTLHPIGTCTARNGGCTLHLLPEYRAGLDGLAGFSHAIALWWAHEAASPEQRQLLTIARPYTATTEDCGVFATRSEARPNPIGLSVFEIDEVDRDAGRVSSPYFDMLDGTPLLDLKPYFPASDRVADARVPPHFSHWPETLERSAMFDWDKEFRH
ncbi:MAG: TrmO family methyltransferase [Pseudomonadota bacterium]